jgi:putative ABC transport system permease protein
VRAAVPCRLGCSVAGISLDTESGRPARGHVTVSGLRTSPGPVLPIGPARVWHPSRPGSPGWARPEEAAGTGSLRFSFVARGTAPLDMDHAALPARLPALVVGALPPGSIGSDFDGSGLDAVSRPMRRAGRLPHSPGAPSTTAVVSLDVLRRDGAAPDPSGTLQVWFARDDPALLARVRAALSERRVGLTAVSHLSATRRTYDDSAAAWSLQLATLVGAVGLLVAAFVLVVVAATTWRRRSRDLAALRLTGLRRSTVSAMAAIEQLVVLGLALVAGTVCGVVGAQLALPTVPLFATAPAVSTLDLGTAWGAVAAAAATAAGCLGMVGWLTSRWLADRAEPHRVRDSS